MKRHHDLKRSLHSYILCTVTIVTRQKFYVIVVNVVYCSSNVSNTGYVQKLLRYVHIVQCCHRNTMSNVNANKRIAIIVRVHISKY